MSGIQELIRIEADHSLSFGHHLLDDKQKKENFEVDGDVYKVKTHHDVTKLEKNGRLLYESVIGTTVYQFKQDAKELSFIVEGIEDAQITVELEPEHEYKLFIQDVQVGKIKSNLAGKLNFSVDFENGKQNIRIIKA